MSLASMGGDLGRSIIGNPKKATLIIHKKPPGEVSSADVVRQTESILSASLESAIPGMGGGALHVIQVQYNPSSINLQANAVAVPMQQLQQNVDVAIPAQLTRPPSVVMSVQLIFDAVNLKDAFMFEKFRLSAGDAVSAVAGGIKSGRKGGYTVRPHTNGLVAMLMRKETSRVTFHWADMAFTGEVSEVSARYTMFSVSGKPIRSTVQLNITQQVSGKADMNYWDKAFDKCFGKEDVAGDSGKLNIGQYAANLVNIGF